ncbi:MAG TPA: hypothetical protein VEB21_17650 [Terriglobales bacterium]|nr:hypothetical protein [Terriglobales bacterium]
MADCFPTTIDGTPLEAAAICSPCERFFSPVNLVRCTICSLPLCADCLGEDDRRVCLRCVEVAQQPTVWRRIPAVVCQARQVPLKWHLTHGFVLREIGVAHVEFVADNLRDRAIMPLDVLHNAAEQLRILREVH